MSFIRFFFLLLLFFCPLTIHSTTCNRFSCDTCHVEFLLEFIIDDSSSVGSSNFTLAKRFTSNIIEALEGLNSRNCRLAYVTFDGFVNTYHQFNSDFTKNTFLTMIDSIPYGMGLTYINLALNDAFYKFLQYPISSGGSRVIVFITDGLDDEFDVRKVKALQDMNVKIFAIGVGSFDIRILSQIATSSELTFTASGYSDLSRIQDAFIRSICDEPIPVGLDIQIASDIVSWVPKYYEFSFNRMKNLQISLKSHGNVQLYVSSQTKTPWQGTNSSNVGSHNGHSINGSEEKLLILQGSKTRNGKVYLTIISDSNSSFSLKTNECNPNTCHEGNNEKIGIENITINQVNNMDCQEESNFVFGLFVGFLISVMIAAGVLGYVTWKKKKRGMRENFELDTQKLARVEMI